MATGTYAPDPAFTGFDNNGNPLNAGKLYTYAAGSSTPQATYSDVSLDPAFQNANPVILDSAGRCTLFLSPTSYKFILKDSADNTIWTRDNISAVPTTNVNLDIDGVAGEAISAGDVVYLSDGSGGNTAGRWYKADADFTYASTLPAIGMAPSDIASAATGSIRLQGRITGLSALVAGTTYYVSATAGALTSAAPANARAVGAADTTTSLVIFSTTSTQAATGSQAGVVSLSAQTLGAGVKTFSSAPVGIPTYSRCSAQLTKNNSTVFSDVTGMSFAIGANEVWDIRFVIHFVSSTAASIKFQLTGPAAPTALRIALIGGGNVGTNAKSVSAFSTAMFAAGLDGWDQAATLSGLIRNGANAGTVQLQAAQSTGDATDTKVYVESHVAALRIS